MGNTLGSFEETSNDMLNEAHEAEAQQDYKEAMMLYLEAMEYIEPGTEEMATCHERLGCLLVRSGELVDALKSFKRALAIKKMVCPESSSTAKTLSNIASVYSGKGEHEKALSILEDCLKIRERSEPHSLKLAKTLSNMAIVLAHLDRHEKAIELHKRVYQIKKVLAPETVSMATTCVNLANLCMRTDPSRSVFYLKRAKIIAETTRPVPYEVLSDVFTVTGHILRHADFFNDAIDMYDQAILFEEYVMPKSPKISTLKQEIEATRRDAEDLESSSPLSQLINETAQRLRHLSPSPNLPRPTKAGSSSLHGSPSSITPTLSIDNNCTWTTLAPSGLGSESCARGKIGAGGSALPRPPSLNGEIDYPHIEAASSSYMLQSLQSLPEGESFESPILDAIRAPDALPATKVTHETKHGCTVSTQKNRDKRHRPRNLSKVRKSGARSTKYDTDMLDYLVKVSDSRRVESDAAIVQSSLKGSVIQVVENTIIEKTASQTDKKKTNATKKKTERKDNNVRKDVKQKKEEESDDRVRLVPSLSAASDLEERHPSEDDSVPPATEYSRTGPDGQVQAASRCPSDSCERSSPLESVRSNPPPNDDKNRALSPKLNPETEKLIRIFRSMLKTPPRARPEPKGRIAPLEP
eukprot:scaffold64_cov150-Amphora_coffeaeformis.AAC.9